MSKQTTTKRSHYLPKTYLKHFLLDDALFMYMKGKKFFDEEKTPAERILKVGGEDGLTNIGLKNNLYNPEIDGISSDDMEEIFRGYGEDYYNELIYDISKLDDQALIPEIIKSKLAYFLASMRVRTPQFKSETEEMDTAFRKHFSKRHFELINPEEIVEVSKKEFSNEISLEEANKIKDCIVKQEYDLKYPNGFFIQMALMMINHYADIFHQMTVSIVKSDGRYFVTSDNPVVYFVPPEKVNFYHPPKALVSPFTELFFPLTKDLAVTLNWRKNEERITKTSRAIVEIFNNNITHHSFDFIFSPIQMKALNKFTKEHIPYPFKIRVS